MGPCETALKGKEGEEILQDFKDIVLSQVKDLCASCCVGRLPSALALLKPTLFSLPVIMSLQLQFAMKWKLK